MYGNAFHVALQLEQNTAACVLLTGTARYQHVIPILKDLHWRLVVFPSPIQGAG